MKKKNISNNYQKATIEDLHYYYIEKLAIFINFLKKNNLHYYAIRGMSLRAQRHHNFILWDVDVDLAVVIDECNHLIDFGKYNNLMSACSYNKEKNTVDNFEVCKKMKFESISINVPENTNSFLGSVYGSNFMVQKNPGGKICLLINYIYLCKALISSE